MNWLRLRKAAQPESEDDVPGQPQWDADYRLQAYPAMGMFEEYLEMGMSLDTHLKCMYITTFFTSSIRQESDVTKPPHGMWPCFCKPSVKASNYSLCDVCDIK